jgi:hypothetical protein
MVRRQENAARDPCGLVPRVNEVEWFTQMSWLPEPFNLIPLPDELAEVLKNTGGEQGVA